MFSSVSGRVSFTYMLPKSKREDAHTAELQVLLMEMSKLIQQCPFSGIRGQLLVTLA